jgi:hypothetical protein
VVRIWVRATLDYDDERAFMAQVQPGFRGQVELWDSVFEMPYRVFRSRVREIARENIARVEGAERSPWDEIPDGALVLPCDDDDWFRPDAARVAEAALGPGVAGLRWPGRFLEVAINRRHQLGIWRARVQGPRPKYLCSTNSYALLASEESKELLAHHLEASRWVARQPAGRVVLLDERLSLMNRTLASQTSLGHRGIPISRRRLLRKLTRYRRLYEQPLTGELAWAKPYADRMGALMDDLVLRP